MAEQKQSCAFRTSIGGQALIEGILMRGPEKQAIVVRDQNGQLVEKVEERSPQTVIEYQERLRSKLNEVLADTTADEQRILTEAAIFADKVAVAEETVRLRSHFQQLEQMLQSDEAIGRKLDFIVQEMNREANTILSKSSDVELSNHAIELKTNVEKVREQVQNIE